MKTAQQKQILQPRVIKHCVPSTTIAKKIYIENLRQRLQLPLDRDIAKRTLKTKRIDKKEFRLQSFFNFCSKSNNTEQHCSEDFPLRRLNKQSKVFPR